METVKTPVAPSTEFKIAPNSWGDKKTKLKNTYVQLNDADLHFDEGKESELTGRLQTKLNKTEAEVQKLISEL